MEAVSANPSCLGLDNKLFQQKRRRRDDRRVQGQHSRVQETPKSGSDLGGLVWKTETLAIGERQLHS